MVSVAPVVGASVPAVGGRGGKRSVKERETGAAPADQPQEVPARGKKALKQEGGETGPVKPRPPPLAGGEARWDGGKRSVKERETETTPASRKSPVMDVSRLARVAWVSTNPQNSKTGAAQVSYEAVGAAKRTGGADATTALGRAVGTCPAITSWTHHPACPLPLRPIARWHRVDEVSHSRGMHTPLTPHGAARSCSRRVEVLRLARLLDTPAGSLRHTHRKTVRRVCPRRVGSIHLVTNARTPTRAPPLDAPVDDRKHAHGRLRFQ